mmetsp:Transcript_54724/g.129936  ORF Transcript_54724/g.129936 Transcript_54724/m.129936 type:complete len:233 (-) Transcript_54724:2914-3612(-)
MRTPPKNINIYPILHFNSSSMYILIDGSSEIPASLRRRRSMCGIGSGSRERAAARALRGRGRPGRRGRSGLHGRGLLRDSQPDGLEQLGREDFLQPHTLQRLFIEKREVVECPDSQLDQRRLVALAQLQVTLFQERFHLPRQLRFSLVNGGLQRISRRPCRVLGSRLHFNPKLVGSIDLRRCAWFDWRCCGELRAGPSRRAHGRLWRLVCRCRCCCRCGRCCLCGRYRCRSR